MSKNYRPRIVVDTNVWLSGLIFGGAPAQVLEWFINGDLVVVMSEELLGELRRTIVRKFPLYVPQLTLLEVSLRKDTLLVKLGTKVVAVSRDPDDDKVLETALIGGCEYIVTGDKDLLSLQTYRKITILTPVQFLAIE